MKHALYGFGTLLFIMSCRLANEHQTGTQDSLLVVLNTQMFLLKQLPALEKEDFLLKDSLSYTDSILYQNILINYQKATSTADSIRMLVKNTLAECDTLNKYRTIKDTA
ncbi:MAG: hypothetical protein D6799_04580, partial [Bacteroidetes bacterium]